MNHRRLHHRRRRGNIVAMTAVLMIVLVAFVALAVDVGYLYTMRNELQRSADSAAIAACWELCDKDYQAGGNATTLAANARTKAEQFAALNKVGNCAPGLASNDVNVGYMANPSNPAEPLISTPAGTLPNSVYVRVQRTSAQNGEVPMFFARAMGVNQSSMQAEATAALLSGFKGFKVPADGDTVPILPFALDEESWNNISSGLDNYRYNVSTKTVSTGGDSIREVNLFPQGMGNPGNRGTLDIGSSNNTTADIARQIVDGVSPSDLAHHGGELTFDGSGELHLNGDTGISAGVKDQLISIVGKTRIIPIFSVVYGPGNNADYTIVKFVGVRVMAVKLTGTLSSKYVWVQPCNIVTKGAIYDGSTNNTERVYSPVWLVR